MEEIFRSFTLVIFIVGVSAFILATLLILPFRRKIDSLDNYKRLVEATVTAIITMAVTVSSISVYFSVIRNDWLPIVVFTHVICAWFISLMLYTVFNLIVFKLILGRKGRLKINKHLSKEMIKYLKYNIYSLTRQIIVCKNDIKIIAEKLDELNRLKEYYLKDTTKDHSMEISEINFNIEGLVVDDREIRSDIERKQLLLNGYFKTLYVDDSVQKEKLEVR